MTTLNAPDTTMPTYPSVADRFAQRASMRLRSRTAWAVGLGTLSVASLALVGAQFALASQRGAAARVQTAWLAAQQVEAGRTNQTHRRAAIDNLMKEAASSGLVATAWDERRFGIRQATMSRKAANRLLAEIARARGHIFAAEQFELSVKDPQDGLFTSPASPDTELIVSLRGSLLYRAKAESK
jgi:hypothetical protein